MIIVSYSGGGDVRNEKKNDQDGKKCLTLNLLEDITEESKVKSGQLQLPGTWHAFFVKADKKDVVNHRTQPKAVITKRGQMPKEAASIYDPRNYSNYRNQ